MSRSFHTRLTDLRIRYFHGAKGLRPHDIPRLAAEEVCLPFDDVLNIQDRRSPATIDPSLLVACHLTGALTWSAAQAAIEDAIRRLETDLEWPRPEETVVRARAALPVLRELLTRVRGDDPAPAVD